MRRHKKLFAFICLISLILCVWAISLLKCEILTIMYEDEFAQNDVITLFGEKQKCKVITYLENEAKVYCVSKQKDMGNLLTFAKKDGFWEIKNWDTIWSKEGNADGVLWPYWWHFIYSH